MNHIKKELQELADPKKALVLQGFFRTGKGEYGEGDVFIGVTVPNTRKVAKKHSHIQFREVRPLLESRIHEERLAGLLILVEKFKKATGEQRKEIVDFYMQNLSGVNNWDLVDLSVDKILGEYLFDKDKKVLSEYARSDSLWKKRIAIVSTYAFIKKNRFEQTLKISGLLVNDKHDLIHKAVGWMLREVGKRNLSVEEKFLKKHYKKMPRTMLRYAIEKLPERERKAYLEGKIND